MLVLRRKKGEALRIGGAIEVRVVRTGAGSAALGITAPRGTHIVREELVRQNSKDRPEIRSTNLEIRNKFE